MAQLSLACFQTRLKQKVIAARYTNHPLVSIPPKVDNSKTVNTHTQTHGLFSIDVLITLLL